MRPARDRKTAERNKVDATVASIEAADAPTGAHVDVGLTDKWVGLKTCARHALERRPVRNDKVLQTCARHAPEIKKKNGKK